MCKAKKIIINWSCKQHSLEWEESDGCKLSKALMGSTTNKSWGRCLAGSSRQEPRLLTQNITGHGHLRYHGAKLGITSNPSCRWCGFPQETALYLLTSCREWTTLRFKWFGKYFPESFDLCHTPASSLTGFWKVAGLP